jgi:flavodoxin
MKPCVVYFSRTGNTKYMGQTIADAIKAPTFDASSAAPSVVADYDVIIFGTPVEGARPAKEALAWVEQLPAVEGKKSILFCTYRLWVAGTFKKLAEVLNSKGYSTILEVQKRNVKQGKTDFSDVLEKVKQIIK